MKPLFAEKKVKRSMASAESACARLCLLTHMGRKENIQPLSRGMVGRMLSLGALEGLALRRVSSIEEACYERAERLLARAAYVYAKLERYQKQGFDVLLPEDALWPDRLRSLGIQMPQFLFVRGSVALLSKRTVAVAGSRRIASETMEIAKQCGKAVADAGITMVCGGAAGVDTFAQRSALDAGGSLILVPAIPARELLVQPVILSALERQQLLLCCDTWPDEAFSAQKALSRNHTIYALGDAALVIAARNGVGGSWRGAVDCLRGKYTPLYTICMDHEDMRGNRALIELGAKKCDSDMPIIAQMF